jgi:adhesin transport system outer membrane protein
LERLTPFFVAQFIVFLLAASSQAETLKEAVQAAVTTNPALKANSAEMKATASELLQLRGEFLPTVEAFGDLGRERVDNPSFLTPADNNTTKTTSQIGAGVELVLFDGFRRSNLVYANAARLDGSIFRLLDASETMALNATEAYIDVYRHRVLARVASNNLERHREIGRKVSALVEGGRLPVSDELTINDRIESADLALLDVQRALRDANARYERVIGRQPSGNMSLPGAAVPGSLDVVTQNAIANSFRLRYAQTQIEQSKFQTEVALADNLPRVSLNAGVTQGRNRGGETGDQSDQFIGLRFNWTLYQGGRKAERNAFAQRTYKAAFERDVAVREVRELSARTWNSFTTNSERARKLNEQLGINRLLVQAYEEEFEAAKRTLLDLLEVERSRFNVEFMKVSADASLAFSRYRVLAVQSQLASHFGIRQSDIALEPGYQAKVQAAPFSVFDVTIENLE